MVKTKRNNKRNNKKENSIVDANKEINEPLNESIIKDDNLSEDEGINLDKDGIPKSGETSLNNSFKSKVKPKFKVTRKDVDKEEAEEVEEVEVEEEYDDILEDYIEEEPIVENKKQLKGNKITNFDFLEQVETIEATENKPIEEESEDEAPEAVSLSVEKERVLEEQKKQKKLEKEEKKKRKELNKAKDKKIKEQKKRKKVQLEEDEDIAPLPIELLNLAANNTHKKEFEIEEEQQDIKPEDIKEQLKQVKKAKKSKSEKVVGSIKVKKIHTSDPWDLPEIKMDPQVEGFIYEALYKNRNINKLRDQSGLILPDDHIGPAPQFVKE